MITITLHGGFSMGIDAAGSFSEEECRTLEVFTGFCVSSAGVYEDDGQCLLIAYRFVPEDLVGIVEDTYCFEVVRVFA